MEKKRLFFIHNLYKYRGGEDISFENEYEFLSEIYNTDNAVFSNQQFKLIDLYNLATLNNKNANRITQNKIKKFKPGIIYFHNTWYKISLGIFNKLNKSENNLLIKLHNMRYFCTRSFLSSRHLNGNTFCRACGMDKRSVGIFNKYFSDSFIKSFFVIIYGKRFFNILKNNKIKILVLTDFHARFLSNLGIPKNRIKIFPNHLNIRSEKIEIENNKKSDFIIYAGRISREKGIFDLITSWENSKIQNTKLLIVGNGPEVKNLKKRIKASKNIEYIGELSNQETIDLIRQSRCVVSATKLFEGQPTIFCEASFFGIPSIFPKAGGIKEFFPENSQLSFSNDNNRIDNLSDTINLINDYELLKIEGKNNKQFIEDKLNKNKLERMFSEIINE